MNPLAHAVTIAVAAVMFTTNLYAEELATRKALTLSITKKIAASAEAFAREHQWSVVIAVVDDGGHLIYLQRLDGVQTGSVEVAIRKARSAAAFKRPSKAFSDAVESGRNALLGLPGAVPLDGGVPIQVNGEFLGAIGVSGVTGEQDGMIATAGAQSLAAILAE